MMEFSTSTDNLATDKLSNWLQAWSRGQLRNGRLDIKNHKGERWSLYFHVGHLIGDSGGVHPLRRWCRQLSQYCPQLGVNPVSIQTGMSRRCWDYESLAELTRKKEVRREQMVAVVQGSIAEILFDILQQEHLLQHSWQERLTYTYVPEETLYSSPLVFVQVDRAWMQAQQTWESWRQAGLETYSPNMAPAIWKQAQLQQQTSPVAYRSLTSLVDGKRTLRDLALSLKQEQLPLTQSIIPYVRKGLMKLVEVGDLGHSHQQLTINPPSAPAPLAAPAPLVAYIDDSARDSQIMGQILTKAGYRYINLQDSVLALPILLEHKPSLIFLDLIMPIANGYEICAQIRRTSIFKDTPVIIVTGNDGIIDRVRAKMVRSTDFVAKPIDAKRVLAILQKYLSVPNCVGFGLKSRF